MKKPINLKQAQQDPEAMKQFIADHKDDVIESEDFDKVVQSMMGKLPISDG